MSLAERLLPSSTAAPAMPDAERFARLRLARSRNVGPRTYTHMLRRFGSAVRALEALPNLAARGGSAGYEPCSVETAEAEYTAGIAAGAELVLLGDPLYPVMLARLESAPPVLWIRGNGMLVTRPAVGIVGARNASALGLRTARRLAKELCETDLVVVSGLARGIDAAAHEAALPTGTIAVLAGGIDCPYPAENAALYERIADGGLVVTECAPGLQPTARHFPRRNRLISGLSAGVVLIEAAARSGSLITARFALEQGREAMACPGAPEDPRVAGCNALIRDGAALIRNAADVLEALEAPRTLHLAEDAREFSFDLDEFGDSAVRDDYDALADFDEEGGQGTDVLSEQIVGLLGPHPVEVDEIARHCGVAVPELSLALLELDLAGRIDMLPGGMIALAPEP